MAGEIIKKKINLDKNKKKSKPKPKPKAKTITKTTKNKGGNVSQVVNVYTGKRTKSTTTQPRVPKPQPTFNINPVINVPEIKIPEQKQDNIAIADFMTNFMKTYNETNQQINKKEKRKINFKNEESDNYLTEAEAVPISNLRRVPSLQTEEDNITEISRDNIKVYKKTGRKPKTEEQRNFEATQKNMERQQKLLEKQKQKEAKEIEKEKERIAKEFAKQEEKKMKEIEKEQERLAKQQQEEEFEIEVPQKQIITTKKKKKPTTEIKVEEQSEPNQKSISEFFNKK